MGYPPGPAAPPPAPPKKSGWVKWVIIGCVGVGFLGVVCCGAAIFVPVYLFKKVVNEVVEKYTPYLKTNERLKAEIGEVKSVDPKWDFKLEKEDGRSVANIAVNVEGERGRGVVKIKIDTDTDGNAILTAVFHSDAGKVVPLGRWRGVKGSDHLEPLDE